MIRIYCIEDINDLKYVGSTKNKLNDRLCQHRQDKIKEINITSSKLNLQYCIIYELERCDEKDRHIREKYWINQIDCVNKRKLNGIDINKKKHTDLNRKRYRATFGGDERSNNNLLLIDVDLFL